RRKKVPMIIFFSPFLLYFSNLRSFRDGLAKKPCSPKSLPTKKSSAFFGIQRKLPGTSCPVQYPALRSWTRRGRLRELHIRCVARKFLYLWIRMTFGRVFPSKARFYYEERLLRKVFEEWKEEWWVLHREWKLCVRANCHYRYYLYNLMFQNWKIYVHQQQEMRNKYIRAEDHDAKQKMQQAWKSWLIYVFVRRTKLQMETIALEFRQRSILQVWWSKWRWQLGQAYMSQVLDATAIKHRSLSLQLQAWSRWREQLLHCHRERQKVISAVRHHQCWQKQTSLKVWLEYLHMRRVKRQQNKMAEQFYHITVLQIYFCDWQWAWQQRQNLYAHQALVEELARRMALRRAFIHWKHYVLLCAEEAAQLDAAEEYHQRSLLLLRRFWNLWQSQIEQKEEREHHSLLNAAWGHYRVTLLHKYIKLWLQYMQKRRYKQLLQARADSHFQHRTLPAVFHTWSRLWRRHQQESILNARAARFHRETLEKQVFAIWWQKMFQHRENRLAERMAILQAERQLLRRSWSTWHQQAATRHQEQEWQAVACAHHHHGQLRNVFHTWRESAQGLRTDPGGCFLLCPQCLALRATEQQKLMRADLHGQRASLRRALQKWLVGTTSFLQITLLWVLRRWRENTVARADEARKILQASAHYRRTMCSKVLVQWRKVASVQIYYRQQKADVLREARKVLDRGYLRTWFQNWRDCSQRAAQQRAQLERAAQHHRRQLLLKGVAWWKVYHLGCVRKKLLQMQGTQLLVQRLSRACFCQWKQQLVARRQEQQSTARALWFWSFSLQAKTWAAWLGFVVERRRKKVRLERAVQAYHQQLLQEGATRLLRFTASMKASRQQLQAQQQVQAAHSLHRAVCHCAKLWKQKALGPGKESRLSAPIITSRRVTFEGPLLDRIAVGAGDAFLETKRPSTPQPQGVLSSLPLAAGEPHLLEPEKPQEQGQDGAQPADLSLRRPFLPEGLPCAPVSKLPTVVGLSPELLPPSSISYGAEALTKVSSWGLPGQWALTLDWLPVLDGERKMDSSKAHSVAIGHNNLETELEGIQQQLQHYQSTKQNLWSCQRQASSLRRWLELSREEPRPEDQDEEQRVQKELEEVELQIQQLAKELQAQRQPISTCIERIQALRQALC
uniref:SFI1 centrin binding protein n=1 Tax=Sciurus vulgaris TaxID=55149 RepID=A0A8D2CWS7_SCIVU